MIKAELRKSSLSKRRELSPDERRSASDRIAENFFNEFDLRGVRFLHVFIPLERLNEVDTKPIVERIWREYPQVETVVPRVDFEANEIASLRFGSDTEVARNIWNIDEPTHNDFVDTELIDMVLVPGLAFDVQGHRVGYGKGFYDRFLQKCRPDCTKIGLSFFEPVEVIENTHAGDIEVNFVITPDVTWKSNRSVPPA